MSFWDNFKKDKLISAHRGYRAIRAENSMSSFEASIGLCDFVELDVGFSKDGVAIIIHDDTLTRTSNAARMNSFISPYSVVDYTFEELSKLDMSTWFMDTDPFHTIENNIVSLLELESIEVQRIPTLSSVLKLFKKYNMPVNIEIKDMRGTVFDASTTTEVISIVQEHGMDDMVMLSSFNHNYISQAKKIAPHITRAALQEKRHPTNIVDYLKKLDVQCYNSDIDIITEDIVRELNSAGIIVNVYTANSDEDKKRLFGYGVKAIFTDFLE